MNYPIEPEVLQMVFRIAFEDDTKWETLSREYCERINQAYEDGRQGKAGYPISAVTELKGIQDAGLLPKGDKWYISKMTKVLTQMCNEAYAQGQIDGKGEEN